MKDEFFFAPDWSPLLQDDPAQNAPIGQNPTHNETTPAPNWGPLIREVLNERALMAKNALGYASQYANADEVAQARRISQQIGITYGEALRNPEEARRIERRQAFGQFVDQYPDQADWILQNAEIAHDDIAAIGSIVSGVKKIMPFISSETGKQTIATLAGPLLPGGPLLGRAAMQGFTSDFMGRSVQGLGETADVGIRSLARSFDLPEEFDLSSYPDDSPIMIAGRALWNEARKMERTGNNPFVLIGRGLKDIGDFVGPEDQDSLISQGGRIVGQGVPMIAAMLLTGGVALPGLMAFGQGADYMADDSRQHQAHGTSEGDTAILKGGALSAAITMVGLPTFVASAFERIKNVVLQFGARLGVGGIVGGAMAGGEQFGDNRLAQSLYDPDRDLWEGVGHRALLGAFGGVVLSVGVTALHVGSAKRGGLPTAKESDAIATLVENNAKAFEAGQIRENVSKLMDDVAASKAAARAPGEVAAMIRRTLGEKNAHVTLAGDALFPLYIRPKLARELGLTQQDIIAAHLKGEDVSVDLGRLAVSEQAQKLKEDLLPHLRREREAMTEAEAAQWEKGGREAFVQEQLAQAREEGEAKSSEFDATGNKTQTIETLLYEDMIREGNVTPEIARQHATFMAKAFEADAARLGVDPLSLYQDARLGSRNIDALKTEQEVKAALKQTDGQESAQGPSQRFRDHNSDIVSLMETVKQTKDLSTILHEFGYFRLSNLIDFGFGQRGTKEARASLKDDLAIILKDLGTEKNGAPIDLATIKDGAEIKQAITEKQREAFVKKWEDYLMKGETPSAALAPVFARFKTWFSDTYKNSNHTLSPELQGVFDRLTAPVQARLNEGLKPPLVSLNSTNKPQKPTNESQTPTNELQKPTQTLKEGGPRSKIGSALPNDPSQIKHILRDDPGHLPDTPANRRLLEELTYNPANRAGPDAWGNDTYIFIRPDGSQVWVKTSDGVIQNGGVNEVPWIYVHGIGLVRRPPNE